MIKKIFILGLFFLPCVAFASFDFNLQYGSTGNDVTELQEFLTTQGNYSGPITGNFYSLTRQGLISFQLANNISPSAGYFGPITRAKVNSILANQETASNAQAVQETGSVTTPTKKDSATSLQEQINTLLAQIQMINSQLQTQTTIQQQTQNTLQQTQQNIQQIQQNTTQVATPTPSPNPSPTPTPTIVKDISITAEQSTYQLTGWGNAIQVKALYTEDGKAKPIAMLISGPDGSVSEYYVEDGMMCLKTVGRNCVVNDFYGRFYYVPKTLGTHTIMASANGVSKSLDIQVIPYVKIDPEIINVDKVGENVVVPLGSAGYAIGIFNMSDADEKIYLDCCVKIQSNSTKNIVNVFADAQLANNTIKVARSTKFIVKIDAFEPGNYFVTLNSFNAIGLTSGLNRNLIGLPITFQYTVQ